MQNFLDRINPELRPVLDMLPHDMLDLTDIPAARIKLAALFGAISAPPVEGVTSEDRHVPGHAGDPDVMVRIYQPVDRPATLPGLFWIHGGGYVLGDIEGDDALLQKWTKSLNCVIVAVDYRLAPEHTFPAPMEDCYAGLKWFSQNAASLGVNPKRVAIGGASAGGGLTAGLALLVRDRGEIDVCFQLPIYPMIDDRNITPASHAVTEPRVWHRKANLVGWQAYLGREPGGEDVSPYAAATRATDLAGLPPAFIPVGQLDLFLDEDIEYAQRLMQAGVPTELNVYAGAFHGFDIFNPAAEVSQRFLRDVESALKRALHG